MENGGCLRVVGLRGLNCVLYRGEMVHLKLDVSGENQAVVYSYADIPQTETGECFSGDCVAYRINGTEYTNIYGLTLAAKKEGGTKTELWIKRALQQGRICRGLLRNLQ